ncbi:hypothetical protein Syun_011122 [Stephania yunnanensis]|uniref:Uncharacterized protein n=1 Tax=Stephania yunnanensis TaxID=152371 RepID=A0AAP0JZB8_9MAGN
MEGELVAVVTKGHGDDHVGGEPIRDSYNMAYMIHFVLGVGNLLPWNTFITAVDYFGHLYPSKHINKVFSVVYMGSSLLVLVLMMSWSSWCWMPNFRCRMNMGLVMFALSLITIPLTDWMCVVDGSLERVDVTYRVTLAAVTVCGLADGLVGGSLIGSAGKLPKRYMQAIFSGTASSGVLVCIFRIITKASLPRTPQACLHGPKWLRTEVPLVFATVALGLTNGYLTSVLMMLAPKSVSVAEAETAGIVMAMFLCIGLVAGSVLGWFWII